MLKYVVFSLSLPIMLAQQQKNFFFVIWVTFVSKQRIVCVWHIFKKGPEKKESARPIAVERFLSLRY